MTVVSSGETPDGAPDFQKKKRAGWRRYGFAGVGVAIVVVTFVTAGRRGVDEGTPGAGGAWEALGDRRRGGGGGRMGATVAIWGSI